MESHTDATKWWGGRVSRGAGQETMRVSATAVLGSPTIFSLPSLFRPQVLTAHCFAYPGCCTSPLGFPKPLPRAFHEMLSSQLEGPRLKHAAWPRSCPVSSHTCHQSHRRVQIPQGHSPISQMGSRGPQWCAWESISDSVSGTQVEGLLVSGLLDILREDQRAFIFD